MNREIKFRGKRVDNGEWVYGYYVQNLTEHVWTGYQDDVRVFKKVDIPHCIVDPYNDYQNSLSYRVIPETVGQYVEILDAYEGDLLHGSESDEYGSILSSWIGVVKWNEEKGRIMIQELHPMEWDWYEVDDFMFDKVTGNMFE
jgi:hypothetical protein